jgi:hypothetical protein
MSADDLVILRQALLGSLDENRGWISDRDAR